MIALDASALLAFLLRETGHQRVAALIPEASMSTVNFSEVLGRFARVGQDPAVIADRLMDSPIEWVSFTLDHAAGAAALVRATQPAGLSLGDRACLALAAERGVRAVTADRAWNSVEVGVEIETIR